MLLKYSSSQLTLLTVLFLLSLLGDIIGLFSNTLSSYPIVGVLGEEDNNNNDRIIINNHLVSHDDDNSHYDIDDEEIIRERMKITDGSNTIADTTTTRTTATKRDPYLYGRNGNPNTSYPIYEYYATPSSNDKDNMDETLKRPGFLYAGNSHYRMVVYYIHWCNTCKDFVTQYITLAKQMIQIIDDYNNNNNPSNDHKIINITFYSISCSPNYLVCKDQHITSYPRIRLYVPYDNDGIDIPSHLISSLTPNYIFNKMGINIHNNDNNNNNNDNDEIIDHSNNWKNNQNMNDNGRDNIVTKLNIESQTNESNKAATGMTMTGIVISKYKQLIDHIMKKIFTNHNNNNNENKINDSHSSSNDIVMIKNNQPNQLLLLNESSSLYDNNDNNNNNNDINDITEYYYIIKRRTRNELMYDIYMSIDYTFRTQIFNDNNKLSIRKQRILYDWLLLLHNAIPYTYDIIHLLLNDIIQNFQYIINDITGQYMNALLNEYNELLSNSNTNFNNDWSISCSYPCGLWSLLHTITIGVVEYNNNTITAGNLYNTDSIALLIRNYIYLFFPCDTCRQHFIQQYNECYFRRCYILLSSSNGMEENEYHWKQLVLWLYYTHNSVNIRLYLKKLISRNHNNNNIHDDVSKFYHILYPSKLLCQKCWKNEEMMNTTLTILILEIISSTNTTNIDSITKILSSLLPDMIHHDIMYQYLRYEYWVRDNHMNSNNYKRQFLDDDIDVLTHSSTNNIVVRDDDEILNHHHEYSHHPSSSIIMKLSNDIEEKEQQREQQKQQVETDIINANKNEHEDSNGDKIGFETSHNEDTIILSNSDVDRHDEPEL